MIFYRWPAIFVNPYLAARGIPPAAIMVPELSESFAKTGGNQK